MISVVIPAYNEEKYVGRCLESFRHQTYAEPFEILVVDNASTDRTAEVARSYADTVPVRVISEPRKGRGPARHAGFSAARGNIILTTDADSILPEQWLTTMTTPFQNPGVIGVTGTCYIADLPWFSNLLFNIIQPTITHLHRLVSGNYWVLGSNGGVRKEIYERSGGYDVTLNSQEDTQFSLNIRKLGTVAFVGASRIETSGRRFNRTMVRGLLEYVRSFIERFIFRKKNVYLRDAR